MKNINTQTEVIATYESSRTRRSLVEGNMLNNDSNNEVIATYESSRTRRSLVEGNILNNDSNNDEEYESNGFYVREKTTSKESVQYYENPSYRPNIQKRSLLS
ncbi:hypothetical protein HUJ05_002019 [Dendroctonus ponderosae]|nr:hypothetical protein HUJ05_002019 [Dendroctonus ponderosae]